MICRAGFSWWKTDFKNLVGDCEIDFNTILVVLVSIERSVIVRLINNERPRPNRRRSWCSHSSSQTSSPSIRWLVAWFYDGLLWFCFWLASNPDYIHPTCYVSILQSHLVLHKANSYPYIHIHLVSISNSYPYIHIQLISIHPYPTHIRTSISNSYPYIHIQLISVHPYPTHIHTSISNSYPYIHI